MPKDIAGAIALLGDLPGAVPEVTTEAAAPEATVKDTPAPDVAPAVDELALKHEAMRERLALTKARRIEAQQGKQAKALQGQIAEREAYLKAEAQKLEARQKAIDETEGKWKAALKDPLKLKELGYEPLATYRAITEAAAAADTPEGHASRLRDEVSSSFEAKLREKDAKLQELHDNLEAIKKSLTDRDEAYAHYDAQQRTSQFFSILKLDKYQDLQDTYEDTELVSMANSWWKATGAPVLNPQAAADALLTWYQDKDKRRKERQAQRGVAEPPAGDPPRASVSPGSVTNGLASAPGTTAKVKLSREERLRAAEADLAAMERARKR